MINIGGNPNDVFYNYKMPPLQSQVKGRCNGMKIILLNIKNVAKYLNTEPVYIVKFFGTELGALARYNDKQNIGSVMGRYHTFELQELLNKFINDFILCPRCKLPELQKKMKFDKKSDGLLQSCMACGSKHLNSSNHKVKKYIIRYLSKTKAKKKVKLKQIYAADTYTNNTFEDNISVVLPVQMLRNYVASAERNMCDILKYVKFISLVRNLDFIEQFQLILDGLCVWDSVEDLNASLKKYKMIFSEFIGNVCDKNLFFGVLEEILCRKNNGELLQKVYRILECLYDNDIVDEEDILLWADLHPQKAILVSEKQATLIRVKASPFIKWLKQ